MAVALLLFAGLLWILKDEHVKLKRGKYVNRSEKQEETMRWVTTKPPKMLMEANRTASAPKKNETLQFPTATSRIPPETMIPETALVSLIRGVCSAGVTFQMTM